MAMATGGERTRSVERAKWSFATDQWLDGADEQMSGPPNGPAWLAAWLGLTGSLPPFRFPLSLRLTSPPVRWPLLCLPHVVSTRDSRLVRSALFLSGWLAGSLASDF
jgi:hypothetical protein